MLADAVFWDVFGGIIQIFFLGLIEQGLQAVIGASGEQQTNLSMIPRYYLKPFIYMAFSLYMFPRVPL